MSGIAGILSPGSALIPRRDTPGAALVEDPKTYHPHAEPWLHNEYGLNLVAGQPLEVNTWRKVALRCKAISSPADVPTAEATTRPVAYGSFSATNTSGTQRSSPLRR